MPTETQKAEQYERLVWRSFGQSELYDKIRFRMNRIREIMSKEQESYAAMPVRKQFEYALTISVIVTHSSMKDMRQFSLSKNKNERFEYAVDEGYEPPKLISLSETD